MHETAAPELNGVASPLPLSSVAQLGLVKAPLREAAGQVRGHCCSGEYGRQAPHGNLVQTAAGDGLSSFMVCIVLVTHLMARIE